LFRDRSEFDASALAGGIFVDLDGRRVVLGEHGHECAPGIGVLEVGEDDGNLLVNVEFDHGRPFAGGLPSGDPLTQEGAAVSSHA
jgi:hypothetical protein